MKIFQIICGTLVWAGLTMGFAAPKPVDLKGGKTPEQIQEAYTKAINALAPNLTKEENLRTFEAALHNAARPGAEVERLACCKAIAAALDSDAPADSKYWMMKLVMFAGKEEVVPALTKQLRGAEAHLREIARCALQQNPSSESATALRQTLMDLWPEKKEPKWLAALALALGAKADRPSLDAMVALITSKDEVLQEAGLAGMGMIAGASPIRTKAGVWKTVPEKLRGAAAESYMKSAERMLREGKASEAAAMYKELLDPELPRAVRFAGLVGLLKSTGDEAANKVLEILQGDDKDARAIATGVIPDLGGGALKVLAGAISKLPADSQVLVLEAVSERGEKAALPVAMEFAKSKDEKLQVAGLSAVGRLGDASSIDTLVEAMQAGGNPGGVAKASLAKLNGEGVNAKIIAAMLAQTDMNRRAAIIEVIRSRGATEAVPVLLEEILKDNSSVRRAAMDTLGRMASPKEIPAMVKGLLKTAPGSERDDAEKAIAAVCARTPEAGKQGEAVLSLYTAGGATEKEALLPVLGRLGGAKVFEVIRAALASSDTGMYQAAVEAISNWPDSDDAVEKELLTLAQKADKTTDRAAALRAYLRVISTPSGIPDKARLAKFEQAMTMAEKDQEKNLVLERVAPIKLMETFRFALKYIEQPELSVRASTTALDLIRDQASLCQQTKEGVTEAQNKAELIDGVKKIGATCEEQGVKDRAARYLREKF